MPNEKYAVFSRDEWDKHLRAITNYGLRGPAEVEDAVVIRRQDTFAPPALDAYSNAILTAVEMASAVGADGEIVERLKHIADYFHEQASISWQTERKLPD